MLRKVLGTIVLVGLLSGTWCLTTLGTGYGSRFDALIGKQFQVTFSCQPLENLPEWERPEQVRDWIVYAFLEAMDVSVKDTTVMLHDQPPLRSAALSEVYSYQYGTARWVWLDEDPWDGSIGDLYAFLPSGSDRKVLASLADEFRTTTGEKPKLVHLIEYEIDMEGPTSPMAHFVLRQTIDGENPFSADFGYRERTIRTQSGLRRFLNEVDDLVYASLDDGELVLGGRDLPERAPLVDLEDAAALYQAYESSSDFGFSLDWHGCSSLELACLLEKLPPEIDTATVSQEEWDAALDALYWDEDLRPLSQVADKLQAEGTKESLELSGTMSSLLDQYCCQCARYDGDIQGTKVAMTMYYCDLLAKLWGFDYQSSTPRAVGMKPVLEIPVSSIYWEEIWTHPSTRVWFEPRMNEFGRCGDSLFLGPLGSRIFAASSNPTAWGQEVQPTPPRAFFIRWWEAHWSEIIEYEPQYFRLGQIMKWTTLMAWLKLQGSMDLLSFQEDESVERGYSFPSWLRAHRNGLTFKGELPFLESSVSTTECLRLLYSEIHTNYGAEGVWLEGGVSGADEKAVQERTARIDEWLEEIYQILRTGSGDLNSSNGTNYEFKNLTNEHGTQDALPVQGARFRSSLSEYPVTVDTVINLGFERSSPHVLCSVSSINDRTLGKFSIRQDGNSFYLNFQPGLAFTAEQLTNARAEGLNWSSILPKLAQKPDLAWQLDKTTTVFKFEDQWIRVIEGAVDDVSERLLQRPSEPWLVKSGASDKPYASAALSSTEKTLGNELGLDLTRLTNLYSEWRDTRKLGCMAVYQGEALIFDRRAGLLRPLSQDVNKIIDDWAATGFDPQAISSETMNCIATEVLEPLLGIDSNSYRLNEQTKVFQLFINYIPVIQVENLTKQNLNKVRELRSLLEAILDLFVTRAPSPLSVPEQRA